MIYLKMADQAVADAIAIEINSFTLLLKDVTTLPNSVISEGSYYYVEVVDQYDYSGHVVDEVVQKLPSQASSEYISGILKGVGTFGSDLMLEFKTENVTLGITTVVGATAGVLEAMMRKLPITGASLEGVSLYDALSSDSLTVADDCIDAMIVDMQANPSNYSNITTWVNADRMNVYKQKILDYLAG